MTTYISSQTQAEMDKISFENFSKVDKKLNTVYKKILNIYKVDTSFIMNLKGSQRIWIRFRDAEVKMMYPDREPGYYGTIHPVCVSSYLEELTQTRIDKLKKWLEDIKKSDGCSGSIKVNE